MDYISYFERMADSLLKDAVIVVAGSGRYGSEEIIRILREQQAKVVYITDESAGASGTEECYMVSSFDKNEIDRIIGDIIADYGKIDVLITNFYRGRAGDFEDVGLADLEALWDNNVKKTFVIINCTASHMKARGGGKIINIASANGKRAYLGASPAECAAAAAVIGLTKGYAEQLAPFNVTVNCIAPGLIDVEETLAGKSFDEIQQALPMKWQPVQKLGSCQDIGYAAAFLASPYAGYITGYTMDVNGGFYMD